MTVRLEKRAAAPTWLRIAIPLGACCLALGIAALVLVISGVNPISTYRSMGSSAFGSSSGLSSTLEDATPLVLTGLCALLAFRVGLYNIGGEGQLYLGAMAASGVGLALGTQPRGLVIVAMILAGAAGGAAWALIPGLLRAFLKTNEILTTLMFNYIGGLLITYLIFDSSSYWRDLTSPGSRIYPVGKTLHTSGSWPALTIGSVTIPFGLLLGVALAVCVAVAFRRSRLGFEMRVVFDSPETGRYAGINTRRLILAVMLGSGALAGIAGASQIGDFSHLLDPSGLENSQFGYVGIVAAALATLGPIALLISAAFLGAITNAGFQLQGPGFPNGLLGTMEGILLACVLVSGFFVVYRIRLRSPRATGRPLASTGVSADPSGEPLPDAVPEGSSVQGISG